MNHEAPLASNYTFLRGWAKNPKLRRPRSPRFEMLSHRDQEIADLNAQASEFIDHCHAICSTVDDGDHTNRSSPLAQALYGPNRVDVAAAAFWRNSIPVMRALRPIKTDADIDVVPLKQIKPVIVNENAVRLHGIANDIGRKKVLLQIEKALKPLLPPCQIR
jgi:hypothetical protein